MMKQQDNRLTLAVIQCALDEGRELNVARIVGHIREAAEQGANVILAPELFEGRYFCTKEDECFFEWARPLEENETLDRLRALAKELGVVLPYSFFEKAGQAYYNSLAMVSSTSRFGSSSPEGAMQTTRPGSTKRASVSMWPSV